MQPLDTHWCNYCYQVGAFCPKRGASGSIVEGLTLPRGVACYRELRRIPLLRGSVNRGRSRSGNMGCVRGSATGEEVYEGTVFSCKDPGHLDTRGCPDGHPGLDRLSATGTRFGVGSSRIWCHKVGAAHAGLGLVVRFFMDRRPPRGRRPALGDDKAEAQAQYPARPDNRPTPKEALVVGVTVPRRGRGCGTRTGLS